MAHLVTHLTYQFLPPLISSVLAAAVDSLVARSGKARKRAKNPRGLLKTLGIEWRDGPQGSDGWRRNRVLTHALVIIAYLFYLTLHSTHAHLTSPHTLYDLLSVPPQITSTGLKTAWRAQSRRYHPDKLGAGGGNGNGNSAGDGPGDGLWVAMREAYEVLMDPNARMAYDRFGPKSITWTQATTVRDYLTRGLTDMATWYCITLGVQLLLAYCRPEMRPGKWVRYYLLALLLAGELSLLLSPISSPLHVLTHALAPSRLPWQWVAWAREQWIVSSLAITQLYPLFYPSSLGAGRDVDAVGAQVRAVFGVDAKEAQGLRSIVQRLGLLAQEMEVGNVVAFDQRKKLVSGVGGASCAAARDQEGPAPEGERLVKVLQKEMENYDIQTKLAHTPIGAPLWKETREAYEQQQAVSG